MASVLSALSFVASLGCLVCLTVLVGFDHSASDIRLLRTIVRGCQWIFIANIAFGLLFRFRAVMRSNHVLKWVVDIALLLTVLPLIYPHPEHPWLPWLEHVLYNRRVIFMVLAVYSAIELAFAFMRLVARRTNPSLLLTGSFVFFIIIGSLVLMLPRCTIDGISYIDSLFLATSAVCITGLTPIAISTTLTPTGLAVLAGLIQIGGLGVLTFTSLFALFFSGNTSVYNQMLLRDLIYSKSMNALGPTLLYIMGFTLTVELIGAAGVYFTVPDSLSLDPTQRLVFSAFHSLSSFCNAGFSCLPEGMSNPALMTPAQGLFNVTSALIFAGAIGFPILVNFKDILRQRLRALWSRLHSRRVRVPVHLYDMNTKLVLSTTLAILLASSVAFFALEYDNTLRGMTLWQKVSQSVFNSLIPRSAGFASVDPAQFLPLTLILVMVQMWIGGASQSLAGGVKVNTFATILLHTRSVLMGRGHAWAWQRRISTGSVRRANAVAVLSVISFLALFAVLIGLEPNISLKALAFEATSALFTVGSSLGITASLSVGSKIALAVAMLAGRVGIISLLSGILPAGAGDITDYLPEENVIIN